ncbi:hypothetical protein I6F07_16125 [Ensifer sp. IC4062]|nr:hypothetical protein [Ensifer sp. IC4062]MCA1441721.1 hypothetical protein [Ensifer sp. IC4062]
MMLTQSLALAVFLAVMVLGERSADLGILAVAAGVADARHIHAVVTTPNGNDQGKDLLRRQYGNTKHTPRI